MKKFVSWLVMLWLPTTISFAAERQVAVIGIQGMACKFCVARMKSNLSKLPGVEKADVSLKENRARVVMRPGESANVEHIKKTIVDTGFTPGEVATTTVGEPTPETKP